MGEGGAEVRAVDRAVARGLGRVDVFAAPAVELDGLLVRDVGQADWEEGVWSVMDSQARTQRMIRTDGDPVVAGRLPEQAVELPHLAQRGGRPALRSDARLDLFPEWYEERGLLREVVESVGCGLGRVAV